MSLQTLETYKEFIDTDNISFGGNNFEIYFEEDDFDIFIDKHIIQVGENITVVCRRFLDSGMTPDEVAGRIIPADASMNDVMNLKAAHVITERAAVAVTRIDCLARFVRDGCGQVSFGLHIRSPLSCDTAPATRPSRAAVSRLRSP